MNEQQKTLSQQLEQRQGLILTPALNQALHMLAMPLLELTEYARSQAEENPVLEPGREDNREQLSYYYAPENSDYRPEIAAPAEQDLYSLLRLQVATCGAPLPIRQQALYIIEHLDEDGYLSLPLPDAYDEALKLVQALEPAGVGARHMEECLSLQIARDDPQRELLITIINRHLPQVAKNQIKETARALKTAPALVEQAFARIRALHPRPAAGLSHNGAATQYIVPDIIIRESGGVFIPFLNGDMEPQLHISAYYRSLASQLHQDKEAAEYLRHKIAAAQPLIGNMEKRRQTLLRLARITAEAQQRFLAHGLEYLAPLTMKEAASIAGFHESTVSRAVAGKYIQTPRGMFSWKFFFPRAYQAGQDIITPAWAKQQLAALISEEDKQRPYSDARLCSLLAAKGIYLARRTVAKYREELHLPPRYLRRRP